MKALCTAAPWSPDKDGLCTAIVFRVQLAASMPPLPAAVHPCPAGRSKGILPRCWQLLLLSSMMVAHQQMTLHASKEEGYAMQRVRALADKRCEAPNFVLKRLKPRDQDFFVLKKTKNHLFEWCSLVKSSSVFLSFCLTFSKTPEESKRVLLY